MCKTQTGMQFVVLGWDGDREDRSGCEPSLEICECLFFLSFPMKVGFNGGQKYS